VRFADQPGVSRFDSRTLDLLNERIGLLAPVEITNRIAHHPITIGDLAPAESVGTAPESVPVDCFARLKFWIA
jgi:hypothetical protein